MKLVRAVFAEYSCDGEVLAGLPHRMALEMALIGGECYLKPVFLGTWQWQVVPRGSILVFSRGCSADCDTMWQIGVDVLPEYRRQGIASAVTSLLAVEILNRGKVPFYCAAWSNLKSVRNAVRCGFRPAWVELTVKPREFVDGMNR